MKTTLITGNNRGIGYEIAKQCVRRNMHVILSGRDETKLQQAENSLQKKTSQRRHWFAVNAVCPGWVRTDMGGKNANRPVERGAETPVWLATEAPQRLTGKFLRDKKEIEW